MDTEDMVDGANTEDVMDKADMGDMKGVMDRENTGAAARKERDTERWWKSRELICFS